MRKLTFDNVRVATIKHDVHGLDIDRKGKDSYRFSEAGAKISVVSSPDETIYKVHKKLSLDDIISNVKDVDLIIIEGYSADDKIPCIGVARKELGKGFKCNFENVIALVSDYRDAELAAMGYKGETFNIDDIDGIIEFIKSY